MCIVVKIVKSDGVKSAYVYLVKKMYLKFIAFIYHQNKLKYNYTVNFI